MNLNRFTEKSQEALREAQSIATRRNQQGVDVEHLMLALVQQSDGLTPSILQAAGGNPAALKERLETEIDRMPQVTSSTGGAEQIYVTPRLNRLLTRAEDEARTLKDEYVSVEHLLLAIADERSTAGKILREQGASRDALMKALQKI